MFQTSFGTPQPIYLVDRQSGIMNGYMNGPVGQEYHHYYGPNGEELPGPGMNFSGRMSGYFPPVSHSMHPRSYTVVGLMERGRVIGLDPEVSTPGVSHLPTHILLELEQVYGHLGNARFSVSCSDGRYSIQAEVLPPPLPPPPPPPPQPPRRPAYFGDSRRGGRRRGARRGRYADEDDYDDDDQDDIVIEIPMETYRKLQDQRRRNGRKPEIIIDDRPDVYEGHSLNNYDNRNGYNQNNNAIRNNMTPNYAGDYYEADDQGQLMQEYRRQQRAKTAGKDDGDHYEPIAMQTGRTRHSEGANTDMGAPPDSYIMDKYLKTYMKK